MTSDRENRPEPQEAREWQESHEPRESQKQREPQEPQAGREGPPEEAAERAQPQPRLHDMGGSIGPASIRGSGARPGGRREDNAEPSGGYAQPMGYMAGRDDDWSETAGSDEKAVAARTDEVAGNEDTFGPSPQRVPETGQDAGHDGDPGFRVRGPVEEEHHGEAEVDEPEPEAPDPGLPRPGDDLPEPGGHVSGDLAWTPSDEDDPDSGSGRTEAGDGGYLPGEATGRPYRR